MCVAQENLNCSVNYCRSQSNLREKKTNFITFVLQQKRLSDKKVKAKNVTERVNRECGFLLEHFEKNSHFKEAEEPKPTERETGFVNADIYAFL